MVRFQACKLILGLLLYVWPGGLVMGTITNGGMGAAMKNAETRYFLTQHSVAMLIAILLINFGSTYARRCRKRHGALQAHGDHRHDCHADHYSVDSVVASVILFGN